MVSVPAVSNAILERRPDLHALLCSDYYRTRQGEEAGGEASIYAMPIFAMRDGKFTTQYSRTFVEAAQKIADDPADDPGPGRGARPAGDGLRRARATRWSSSRATSSS